MKHFLQIWGEGSLQNFRKSDGGNIKLKVTLLLDGPLLRPRAKNGGFQLVCYKAFLINHTERKDDWLVISYILQGLLLT